MTIRVFPFSEADVGTYSADYWAAYVHSLFGVSSTYPNRGVIMDVGSELLVSSPASGRAVDVAAGAALVGGRMFHNDASASVSLSANTSGNPRFDLICARWVAATQTASFFAVEGTPAATPVIPSPTQTSTDYMIPLAAVYLVSGYSSVNMGYVVDLREWVGAGEVKVGFLQDYAGDTDDDIPVGWLYSNGETIGASNSGASGFSTSGQAYRLFARLWNQYGNTELAIQDSAGSAATRGSTALIDFIAQKRMPLPDLRGRITAGYDNQGTASGANRITASWADTPGGTGGAETHTLSIGELPAHDHGGVTGLSGAGSSQFAGGGAGGSAAASSQGSGTAHNNLQPTMAVAKLIRWKGNS